MLDPIKSLKENGPPALSNKAASIMIETTGGCCWEWDVTARRLHLIPDGLSLFGKSINTCEELIELLHPYDVSLFQKKMDRFFVTDPSFAGETESMDFRIRNQQGEWKWFTIRRSHIDNSSEEIVRVTGSILDVDTYKCAIEVMRSSEARLETIFKNASGSMAVMDTNGKLIEANQAFYDMFAYSAKDLQGVFVMSLSAAEYMEKNGELMAKILLECERREDKNFRREEDFIRSNGERITVNYGLSAIYDVDGNIVNYIFSGMNITSQIKYSAELKHLAEKQRWLFTFLRQFNQFDGIATLFDALKKNLPNVVSFCSLKLIVPSFLDKPCFFDNTCETYVENEEKSEQEIDNVLAGNGLPGSAYVNRVATSGKTLDGARFTLAVPLLYKEKAWGILALESDSGAFSDEDVTLMNILGSNIALYFEELSSRSELAHYTQQLHRLHILIRTLLLTHNRDHLLEGMLGYLKSIIPDSACAVYLFAGDPADGMKMERLAWYDEEEISVPDSALTLKSAHSKTPLMEYTETGLESRRVSPIVFQSRVVGAVDIFKPIGIQPKELKMYQLLIDYVSSFWMLYDLIAKSEEEASVDPLTGIWNRRYMIRRFQEEAERITRYGGNACVVIGDMGNFKHINDEYGHTKGDEVLINVAKTLKKCLRISDSVGRYGGDEFIMLLPNISIDGAQVVLERIKTELGLLNIKSGDDVNAPVLEVVLDFGAAVFPGEASTLMDTINLADEDMYVKKTARKKRLGLPLTRQPENGAERT